MQSIIELVATDPLQAASEALAGAHADAHKISLQSLSRVEDETASAMQSGSIQIRAASRHLQRIHDGHLERFQQALAQTRALVDQWQQGYRGGRLHRDFAAYWQDAIERLTLTLDALRKRGDIFLEHEAAECPPVLIYDYEPVMDGHDLPRPTNYQLLRILPPEGVKVHENRRPYIVIDPRAGHGPGIGGFKTDSQVGVAMRAGHPVYFVAFRRTPVPGQTIADITRCEAEFVREVMRRHPHSNRPVIVGNCQGGWATLLLVASHPDLTGPVVINGAPVATWSGEVGANPMRYNAGVLGGTWIPMFLSDIGAGRFDGAHLVQNFELLNPSRTLLRKYTDLYRDIDHAEPAFLEFERWWGGYFLLNEPEIRWIVEQLFVGNRLVRNEASLEPGVPVDLKAIHAPIVVFASHGDNITPPQQALNWIVHTYADVNEIRVRGQRIVYMVHHEIGHLGIFVSSKIANREHQEMGSTIKTIEALAPGLYEMRIDDVEERQGMRHFTVSFVERTLDDIRALDDGQADEQPFAAVARTAEVQAQWYDAAVRPLVRSVVTDSVAEWGRTLHPQRLGRAILSSRNPWMSVVGSRAEALRGTRQPAAQDNPFVAAESLWVHATEQMIDLWRDGRDMMVEMAFHTFWSTPWARTFGNSHGSHRPLDTADALRALPQVKAALYHIERGGLPEAVIRMLVLLADNRRAVRRDRLERSSRLLTTTEPFRSLGAERRAMLINEQTLIAAYEPERAIETLPGLLSTPEDKARAMSDVHEVVGAIEEMSEGTLRLIQRFRAVLGLSPLAIEGVAPPAGPGEGEDDDEDDDYEEDDDFGRVAESSGA